MPLTHERPVAGATRLLEEIYLMNRAEVPFFPFQGRFLFL
jgi:hypothetical protein